MSGVLPERRAEVNGEVEHRGRQSHDSGAHEQCLTLRQQGRGIGGSDARHEEQLNLGEAQVGHNLLIGAVYSSSLRKRRICAVAWRAFRSCMSSPFI